MVWSGLRFDVNMCVVMSLHTEQSRRIDVDLFNVWRGPPNSRNVNISVFVFSPSNLFLA